jgi:hypothetical protein
MPGLGRGVLADLSQSPGARGVCLLISYLHAEIEVRGEGQDQNGGCRDMDSVGPLHWTIVCSSIEPASELDRMVGLKISAVSAGSGLEL